MLARCRSSLCVAGCDFRASWNGPRLVDRARFSVHSCPYNVLPVAVSPARSRRIGVRVAEQQDALTREAASLAGETVPGFLLGAAQERARKLLDERRRLVMSDQAFADFTAALDEPAVAVSELQELFALPRIPQR